MDLADCSGCTVASMTVMCEAWKDADVDEQTVVCEQPRTASDDECRFAFLGVRVQPTYKQLSQRCGF